MVVHLLWDVVIALEQRGCVQPSWPARCDRQKCMCRVDGSLCGMQDGVAHH